MRLLTFDIEDWFHLLDHDATRTELAWAAFPTRIYESVDRILALLAQRDVKATFFCLGWMAERYPEVIKLIDDAGHEIGSHSYSHQLVSTLSVREFQQDVERSVRTIEDLIGKKVRMFRAPGFSVTGKTPWFIHTLRGCGIEIDCSVTAARHSHGGERAFPGETPRLISYRGVVIKEFPLNAWGVRGLKVPFSGGGYFRLLPYWLISRLMRRSGYAMTYFHPRDFDPEQPLLQGLSPLRRFKSYYGLSTSFGKLSNLLRDFEFLSVGDADRAFRWDAVPVFELDRRLQHPYADKGLAREIG